jgi:hypothetical protein
MIVQNLSMNHLQMLLHIPWKMRMDHNHLQKREIVESKKEVVAADFQSEGTYFVQ